jgi:hypothetical protein
MPNSSTTNREFDQLHDMMREGFAGLNDRLDTLNGRTRKIEISSAVQWMLWVLLGSALTLLVSLVH